MLFIFFSSILLTLSYYAFNYLKQTTKPLEPKSHSHARQRSDKFEMSDDEFCDPSGASKRWAQNQRNQDQNAGSSSLFSWKRERGANASDNGARCCDKRPKLDKYVEETESEDEAIVISDDDSDSNNAKESVESKPAEECVTISDSPIKIDDSDEEPPPRKIHTIFKPSQKNPNFVGDKSANPSIFSKLKGFVPSSKQETGCDKPTNQSISSKLSEIQGLLKSKQETADCNGKAHENEEKPRLAASSHELLINATPVKFPVPPYSSQIAVMNAIIRGCSRGEHCLLESPTGSGKTLALLCAALAWQSRFKQEKLKDAMKYVQNGDLFNKASDLGGCCAEQNEKQEYRDGDKMQESNLRNPRIFYGSRTHKQIEQVIREFRKTAYADTRMTILSSREHTCLQQPVKGKSKTQLCHDLINPIDDTSSDKNGQDQQDQESQKPVKTGCDFYNARKMNENSKGSVRGELPTPWDNEDLVEWGRMSRICPYFTARDMMIDADIIFCPYNYLIDPVVRDSMQINVSGDVVIIDEAHNIEGICRDVRSSDFREDALGEAIQDCTLVSNVTEYGDRQFKPYQIIKNYLTRFQELISNEYFPDNDEECSSECWTGTAAWQKFELNNLGGMTFMDFEAACLRAIKEFKEIREKIEDKDPDIEDLVENLDDQGKKKKKKRKLAFNNITKRLVEELLMALTCIKSDEFAKDYRCVITKAFFRDAKVKEPDTETWISRPKAKVLLRTFKFICMNSAIAFEGIAKPARCVVLASGTLSPVSTFESELGIRFAQKLSANHVVSKDQVYIRGIGRGPRGTTLKATYEFVHTLPFKDDLGSLLVQVCEAVPHGVLCFFSSYTMMTSQRERWEMTGVLSSLARCKQIVWEPRSNADLDEVMSDFRSCVRDTGDGPSCDGITGALLFAVFRGKVAEGIDFSDNEARCVLTVGIPFAVQSDPTVKLKREYNDLHRSRGLLPGGEWYAVQAYRALNQALGRCIRHRNDWGAVLLVDQRLVTGHSCDYLPKWVKGMKRENQNYNLSEELRAFVSNQRRRDEERART